MDVLVYGLCLEVDVLCYVLGVTEGRPFDRLSVMGAYVVFVVVVQRGGFYGYQERSRLDRRLDVHHVSVGFVDYHDVSITASRFALSSLATARAMKFAAVSASDKFVPMKVSS